jgi:polyisoprenoid-binding protein YceI
MKTHSLVVAGLAAFVISTTCAFTLLSNAWKSNAEKSKIHFTMPNGKHDGDFGGLNCSFDFDPANPAMGKITASIDVKTLKADNPKLTGHLLSADFFDAEKHPQITFTSESVTPSDSGFVATGKLAMRDSVKTVSIPFKFIQDGNAATAKGMMDIFAGDYGVGKKSDKGNDRVQIWIEVPMSKE